MRILALAASVLILAGCSSTADPSSTNSPGGGPTTTGVSPSTESAATPSPVTTGELTIPEPRGEIARSVFGANPQDVVSGEAVEGATLEARVACVDPGRGTASFEVLDASEERTGVMGIVLSGQFACDGAEVFVSTTAPFSGPLQITFTHVPDTAVEGYAILATN